MLLSLIHSLPCIVSLLWFLSFLLKKKSSRQHVFCHGEGISVVVYAILGIYFFPNIDYDMMAKMEVISIPAGTAIGAYVVAYMYMHYTGRRMKDKLFFALLVPSVMSFMSVCLLCYIMGFDKAADVSRQFASPQGLVGEYDTDINHLYCFFTYYIFIVLLAAYITAALFLSIATLRRQGYRFGDVFRFFFRGHTTTPSRAIAVLYIIQLGALVAIILLGSVFIAENVVYGILLSIILAAAKHFIAYVEFYSDNKNFVTLYQLSHLTLNAVSANVDAPLTAPVTPSSDSQTESAVTTDTPLSPSLATLAQVKADERIEMLHELMEVKKVWMNEELTSQDICDMMNIGKTTLSSLVNQHYSTTFRELVNTYRIEEAKQYIIANPTATQDVIAQHCGFKNAQYFNTLFKKYVGETPAMWYVSYMNTQS